MLCGEYRYLSAFIDFILAIAFLCGETVIRQLQAHVVSSHASSPVEDIAASEVQQSERVLIGRIVLDIDAVVCTLKEAHSHVSRVISSSERPWL